VVTHPVTACHVVCPFVGHTWSS